MSNKQIVRKTTFTANNEPKDILVRVTLLLHFYHAYGLEPSPLQMKIPENRYTSLNDCRAWGRWVDFSERMSYFLGEFAKNLTAGCCTRSRVDRYIFVFSTIT